MIWIKICGITSAADANAAIDAGVSAIGLVFATSPRQVSIEQAAEIAACARDRVEIVGVFKEVATVAQAHAAIRFDRIQIHSDEPLQADVPILRARHPESREDFAMNDGEMILMDGSEGRGQEFSWVRAQPMVASVGRVVIAGGLTPDNVGSAIAAILPFGVDVSSGVESAPAKKDRILMTRFVEAVRRADGLR
ncbi:MAG: phosphoribosylanthranilate isomerase [Vicinamibacteria bacterium]